MDEICGLQFHLSYVDMPQIYFLEIPPCALCFIFIAEFALLIKTPSYYEVNSFNRK
jgi:hypothetical protein